MSADMMVEQCYLQECILVDQAMFIFTVPYLSECHRAPLFQSTQLEFYTLAITTFEDHPKCANIAWKSTDSIYDAALPEVMLTYS
jgi:hypothetical protein